jgi:membrane-bound lytic murein transglycosylase D
MMLSNFRILHSWPLAVTAYNHGPGGLIRGQKQAKSSALAEIILKYKSKSFSFASQNFFCEFLAALHGERYQEEVFGEVPKYPALAAETIDLKFRMRAQTLADIVGVTIEELKLFNPDLKSQAVSARTFIPAGYHIRLPKGRKARLEIFNYRSLEAGSKKPSRNKAS